MKLVDVCFNITICVIVDIQGEDTGSLLCQKLPGESRSAEVKLKVQGIELLLKNL